MITADQAAGITVLAQRSLAAYCIVNGGPEYDLAAHIRRVLDVLEALERGDILKAMFFMPPQNSKALALDTPIPTPTGWTTMGALSVGDTVFDDRGRQTCVVAATEVMHDHDCYRVQTDDGYEIVADAGHLWSASLDRRRPDCDYTTAVIARDRGKRARVRANGVLDLAERELPVPPYTLGAWLGDGTTTSGAITNADAGVLDGLRSDGFVLTKRSSPYGWGVLGLRGMLVRAGVLNDKHIPPIYLRASARQRRALLHGLIDTDGHVSKRGQVCFTNTNRGLVEGVRELVHSLGSKASMYERRAMLNGRDCGPVWSLSFWMADAARLPRKAERCRDAVKNGRYITAERVSSVPVRCISVDSPTHMYLAGRGMVPTHNSYHASQRFPAWYLGRHPTEHVVLASYGQELASRNGRIVRGLLASEHWPFEVGLAYESRAMHRWGTSRGGGLVAVGVGGGLTGNPGHLIVIDDAHKDREEADSPLYRERAWEWWTDVVQTRRAPQARELLAATRWHEDDLPGRILNSDGGGDWTVLSLPALAEEDDPLGRDVGEALWPDTVATAEEWDAQQRSGVHRGIRPDPFLAGAYRKPKYPLAWLEAVKRTLPARSWAALYQQRPVPMEGAVIRGEWIQHWTALPPDRVDAEGKPYVTSWQVIQTVDSAWDEGVEHDPSAIATWATDGADYYLLDYWSGNVDFPDLQAEVVRRFLSQRWRPTYIFVEDAANGRPLIQQLARTRYQAADGTSVSLPVAPFRPEGAKIARLEAVTPLFSTHNVYVPTAAPWLADFLAELVGFPYMTHDESADTTSSALLKLAPWLSQRVGLQIQMGPQGLPETPARRRIREYEERQQRARRGPQWPRGGVQVPGVSGPVRPRG